VPRLEIRVIVLSDISLDSHRRLIIETIHRYLCDLFLLSDLSMFSYLLWSLFSFCRYSCTYLILELLYIWRLFLYWGLAYVRKGISALRMYVAITSPYLRDRGITMILYFTLYYLLIIDALVIWTTPLMRAHQLKMNPTKSFLGVLSGKSWNSLLHLKEFNLIWTRSKPFKICSLQRISKNSEVFKAHWLIFVGLLYTCRIAVNHLHD